MDVSKGYRCHGQCKELVTWSMVRSYECGGEITDEVITTMEFKTPIKYTKDGEIFIIGSTELRILQVLCQDP